MTADRLSRGRRDPGPTSLSAATQRAVAGTTSPARRRPRSQRRRTGSQAGRTLWGLLRAPGRPAAGRPGRDPRGRPQCPCTGGAADPRARRAPPDGVLVEATRSRSATVPSAAPQPPPPARHDRPAATTGPPPPVRALSAADTYAPPLVLDEVGGPAVEPARPGALDGSRTRPWAPAARRPPGPSATPGRGRAPGRRASVGGTPPPALPRPLAQPCGWARPSATSGSQAWAGCSATSMTRSSLTAVARSWAMRSWMRRRWACSSVTTSVVA